MYKASGVLCLLLCFSQAAFAFSSRGTSKTKAQNTFKLDYALSRIDYTDRADRDFQLSSNGGYHIEVGSRYKISPGVFWGYSFNYGVLDVDKPDADIFFDFTQIENFGAEIYTRAQYKFLISELAIEYNKRPAFTTINNGIELSHYQSNSIRLGFYGLAFLARELDESYSRATVMAGFDVGYQTSGSWDRDAIDPITGGFSGKLKLKLNYRFRRWQLGGFGEIGQVGVTTENTEQSTTDIKAGIEFIFGR